MRREIPAGLEISAVSFRSLKHLVGAKSLHLWYQWSVDGEGAVKFHAKCNIYGPTLVIGSMKRGGFVGGFTSVSWTRSGYCADSSAFLFTINHGEWDIEEYRQTGMLAHQAVYCRPSYGPFFGTDLEFVIDSNPRFTYGKSDSIYQPMNLAGRSTELSDVFVFSVSK